MARLPPARSAMGNHMVVLTEQAVGPCVGHMWAICGPMYGPMYGPYVDKCLGHIWAHIWARIWAHIWAMYHPRMGHRRPRKSSYAYTGHVWSCMAMDRVWAMCGRWCMSHRAIYGRIYQVVGHLWAICEPYRAMSGQHLGTYTGSYMGRTPANSSPEWDLRVVIFSPRTALIWACSWRVFVFHGGARPAILHWVRVSDVKPVQYCTGNAHCNIVPLFLILFGSLSGYLWIMVASFVG